MVPVTPCDHAVIPGGGDILRLELDEAIGLGGKLKAVSAARILRFDPGGLTSTALDGRAAVAGYLGFVALLLQVEMEQLCDIIVVLYDQNLLGHWVHQPFIFLPYSLL